MTLTLNVSRSNFEIALSQELLVWLVWNENEVSYYDIGLMTSVTMVGWADLPDSDWGDFRRRRDVDISRYFHENSEV